MFFLLRCAFWLGLTFSMMDWPGGATALPDAGSLAQAAAGQISTACTSNPHACLDGARRIEALRSAVEIPAPPRPPRRSGADTLKGADLQPTWRGRS